MFQSLRKHGICCAPEAPIAATVAGWSFGFGIAAVIALIGAVVAAATLTPTAVRPKRGRR